MQRSQRSQPAIRIRRVSCKASWKFQVAGKPSRSERMKFNPKTVEYNHLKLMNCLNVYDIPGSCSLCFASGIDFAGKVIRIF